MNLQNRNKITDAENKPMVPKGGTWGEGWTGSRRLTYIHYSIQNRQLMRMYCRAQGLPGAQTVKNLPAKWETWVQPLRLGRLEQGMSTHSTILAWRIPWTEEPSQLQSMGSTKSQTRLNTGNSAQYSIMTYMGKYVNKREYVYMFNWFTLLYTWN